MKVHYILRFVAGIPYSLCGRYVEQAEANIAKVTCKACRRAYFAKGR